jgi:hypothetical protein
MYRPTVVKPTAPDPEIDSLSRTQILIAMAITAILLLVIARVWVQVDPTPQLPLHWRSGDFFRGLALAGVITGGSALLYQFWSTYRLAADTYLYLVLKPLFWPDVLWLGLLPGLSEELLFRGVMLPAFGANWMGLVISSCCFGILHMSGLQQWSYALWATLVGLMLGYSALATGNLLVPVTAHILTNLLASMAWKWVYEKRAASSR